MFVIIGSIVLCSLSQRSDTTRVDGRGPVVGIRNGSDDGIVTGGLNSGGNNIVNACPTTVYNYDHVAVLVSPCDGTNAISGGGGDNACLGVDGGDDTTVSLPPISKWYIFSSSPLDDSDMSFGEDGWHITFTKSMDASGIGCRRLKNQQSNGINRCKSSVARMCGERDVIDNQQHILRHLGHNNKIE